MMSIISWNAASILTSNCSLTDLSVVVKKSIHFLSKDCGLVHRNINLFSVFVDLAGEWKLGGVEFMCGYADPAPPGKQLEELRRYDPPEASKSLRRSEKW